MNLCIIGSGYVGLVTGACFAEAGHHVTCVDSDLEKVKMLQEGYIPIYEPGLEELIQKNSSAGRLQFTGSIAEGVAKSIAIFIAVPTPPREDGSVDLTFMEKVSRQIAEVLTEYRVIVDKSTVPVKTGEKVTDTIRRYNRSSVEFDVVSNPEFLREGSAIDDLMKPDRIVVGSSSKKAAEIMMEIYKPFPAKVIHVDLNSAELIKHASNSFLALKISYINALAIICEESEADVMLVAEGMGADHRIGRAFLNPGLGYGGSCFPKDLSAFIKISEDLGYDFQLLREVQKINAHQMHHFLKKVRNVLWVLKEKKIGQLGLAFKGNTDDVRSSVAVSLAQEMISEGAIVTAYDPKAMEKAEPLIPGIKLAKSALEVAQDADALIIATEWKDFLDLPWEQIRSVMRTPTIFDGRNLLNPEKIRALGFEYYSVGR